MMKIYSVYDKEFKSYGKVLENYDTKDLLAEMDKIPHPDEGTSYLPNIEAFDNLPIKREFSERAFGGMPIELGMCWGHNTRLNCLEYHRDSEVDIAGEDMILLLAKIDEIENGVLDTACVKAFLAPKGAVVEVYATTLHYAPCHAKEEGFRSAVVLPLGTNTDRGHLDVKNDEDKTLWAKNKWLLAHKDSSEAKSGAYIGLIGKNIDIREEN